MCVGGCSMGDGWWVFNTLVHRGLSIHEKALVSCLLLDVTMQEVLRQSDFPKDERDSARNSQFGSNSLAASL